MTTEEQILKRVKDDGGVILADFGKGWIVSGRNGHYFQPKKLVKYDLKVGNNAPQVDYNKGKVEWLTQLNIGNKNDTNK